MRNNRNEPSWWVYIIIAALIAAIVCVSCNNISMQDNSATDTVKKYKDYEEPVIVFPYKEHTYIQFGEGNWQWGTHDPDCTHPNHVIRK